MTAEKLTANYSLNGPALAAHMAGEGVEARDIAYHCKVTGATVAGWLKGKNPTLGNALDLAELLGCGVRDLCTRVSA